ncbi:unnamed protein product [Leuciscus chuanchicus]
MPPKVNQPGQNLGQLMLNDLRAGRDENRRESGNTITILMNTTQQSPSQSTQRQRPSILFLLCLSLTRFLESQVSSPSRPSLHQLPHSGNPDTKTIREFPERLSPSCARADPALPSPSARLCTPHGSFSFKQRAESKEKLLEMASPPVLWPGLKAKSGQQFFTRPLPEARKKERMMENSGCLHYTKQ